MNSEIKSGDEPTCTDTGVRTNTAEASFGSDIYTEVKTGTVPATGVHDWSDPVFDWTNYDPVTGTGTVTATRTCSSGGESETVTCTVNSEIKSGDEATCTDPGTRTNTATAVFGTDSFEEVKTGTVPATGVHDWSDPVFDWSNYDLVNGTGTVTATRTCSSGGESETVTCTVNTEIKSGDEPGCTETGKRTNTATAAFGTDSFEETKTGTVPATGHDWSDPVFDWSNYDPVTGEGTVTATRTCNNCGETQTVDVTPTQTKKDPSGSNPGEITSTVTANFGDGDGDGNDDVFTDTKKTTTYSITLDYNDGSGRTDTIIIEAGKSYKLPTVSRTGYTAGGWSDGNGNKHAGGTTITPTVNTKLTAQWTQTTTGGGTTGGGTTGGGTTGGGTTGGGTTPTQSATVPTPAPVPTTEPVAEPEVIDEPETPLAEAPVEDEKTNTIEGEWAPAPARWALVNLLTTIASCLAALGMGITCFRNKEEAERKYSKFLGLLPAGASTILFTLTETISSGNMRLVDKWTLPMVGLLAVSGVVAYLTRNKKAAKV